MQANIYIGRDWKKNKVFINFNKENIHRIVLSGESGSGKSIFHSSLYQQLVQQNTPEQLGFVFLDMTKLDFSNFPYSAYLYKPVIVDMQKALECFDKLGKESKSKKPKSILIHIEECDMIYHDRKRFEQAWLNIASNKDKNDVFIVFSSSRCCPEVFTKTILDNTDLKILFFPEKLQSIASRYDEYSTCLFGKKLKYPHSEWQRILATNKKELLYQGYLEEEVNKFNA